MVVDRCYFQFGDTCHTECPQCHGTYRVTRDNRKSAASVVEQAVWTPATRNGPHTVIRSSLWAVVVYQVSKGPLAAGWCVGWCPQPVVGAHPTRCVWLSRSCSRLGA